MSRKGGIAHKLGMQAQTAHTRCWWAHHAKLTRKPVSQVDGRKMQVHLWRCVERDVTLICHAPRLVALARVAHLTRTIYSHLLLYLSPRYSARHGVHNTSLSYSLIRTLA